MSKLSVADLERDDQGRRYPDVTSDPVHRRALEVTFDEMQDAQNQRRMKESETYHNRPALGGCIKVLEANPAFAAAFAKHSDAEARRFKQAVGVACRMVMEASGWMKTAHEGSIAELSQWFSKARHYAPRTP